MALENNFWQEISKLAVDKAEQDLGRPLTWSEQRIAKVAAIQGCGLGMKCSDPTSTSKVLERI